MIQYCNASKYTWYVRYGVYDREEITRSVFVDKTDNRVMRYVLSTVAVYFRIDPDKAIKKGRCRDIVQIRQISCYFINKYWPHITLSKIGRFFNQDHSTIIYSIETINDLMDTSKSMKLNIKILNEKFKP